jgi:hypothetical protein
MIISQKLQNRLNELSKKDTSTSSINAIGFTVSDEEYDDEEEDEE